MSHTILDKNFKCPKSLKVMLAGRPKSEWRMHFDAHVASAGFKRRSLKQTSAKDE